MKEKPELPRNQILTLEPRRIGEALMEVELLRPRVILWMAIFDSGCSPKTNPSTKPEKKKFNTVQNNTTHILCTPTISNTQNPELLQMGFTNGEDAVSIFTRCHC